MKPLLRAEDIAPLIGKSVSGVYTAARMGHIPARRYGRSVRFDLDEVIEAGKKSKCLRRLKEWEDGRG